ncbi:hypothetical protein OIE66_35225 [Nonomuraea sp. NBC_01738]|nr:hypothetical protein OIE66_35225 [Nonomuraea sp. NBC_01738]
MTVVVPATSPAAVSRRDAGALECHSVTGARRVGERRYLGSAVRP